MKKQYEAPEIYMEEYELENVVGDICLLSGTGDVGGIDNE